MIFISIQASYSDVASLASYPDSATLHDDNPINSYVRVQRLDCKLNFF